MQRCEMIQWYHQQESNLYLALRRHSFCPLNYGGGFCVSTVTVQRVQLYAADQSIVGQCKNQIDRTLLTRLGANGQAFGQVVENVQRAQGA